MLKPIAYKQKQQGYSLFLVMILMLVIAFLVIATSQTSLTESRSSANEADRKLALSYAEAGLRAAEGTILSGSNGTGATFSVDCTSPSIGLCKPAQGTFTNTHLDPFQFGSGDSTTEAWKRGNLDNKSTWGRTCLVTPDRNACYIIEYMGYQRQENREIFRVTSRAYGQSDETMVTLQSYVELLR